ISSRPGGLPMVGGGALSDNGWGPRSLYLYSVVRKPVPHRPHLASGTRTAAKRLRGLAPAGILPPMANITTTLIDSYLQELWDLHGTDLLVTVGAPRSSGWTGHPGPRPAHRSSTPTRSRRS